MKHKNRKTGKIVDVRMSYREDTAPIVVSETTCDENGQSQGWPYDSLAELNEEWEDYEEPKGYWMITSLGEVICPYDAGFVPKSSKEIGNYFDTREEAEKAVEKLKAWKRLKDNSWMPFYYDIATREANVIFSTGYTITEQDRKDLDLLFGGEDE